MAGLAPAIRFRAEAPSVSEDWLPAAARRDNRSRWISRTPPSSTGFVSAARSVRARRRGGRV